MPKKAENPYKMGYDPELDTSPELDPDTVSYYLTNIGIFRWIIKMGKIDITTMEHSPERDILKQQYMSWSMLVRGTIPDLCMILYIQK